MTNKHQDQSAQYIQNRTNWCWAVACRMVGEQFKRNHPEFAFHILPDREENWVVRTNDRRGLRKDVVKWDGDFFLWIHGKGPL